MSASKDPPKETPHGNTTPESEPNPSADTNPGLASDSAGLHSHDSALETLHRSGNSRDGFGGASSRYMRRMPYSAPQYSSRIREGGSNSENVDGGTQRGTSGRVTEDEITSAISSQELPIRGKKRMDEGLEQEGGGNTVLPIRLKASEEGGAGDEGCGERGGGNDEEHGGVEVEMKNGDEEVGDGDLFKASYLAGSRRG
ncbi:hypothetical protein P154DRAFT_570691 [Amniculicola lignicola CBS 123094]|uniref:Uncharacterized protein n=1 Tax=Amniculicola lignicola CBS 123094 TaxID=1392246 RepID=A0A6A5WYB4_9PLEO|nr:hypothetical protein P154DRAFT_570691 [Amniculicola lignicola CBS 123094]